MRTRKNKVKSPTRKSGVLDTTHFRFRIYRPGRPPKGFIAVFTP